MMPRDPCCLNSRCMVSDALVSHIRDQGWPVHLGKTRLVSSTLSFSKAPTHSASSSFAMACISGSASAPPAVVRRITWHEANEALVSSRLDTLRSQQQVLPQKPKRRRV